MQTKGNEINNKKCSKCGQLLPATTEYFYKMKTGKYGVMGICISCDKDRKRLIYESKLSNSDRITANIRLKKKRALSLEAKEGVLTCNRCGTTKPISSYIKDKRLSFGVKKYCRSCYNKASSNTYRSMSIDQKKRRSNWMKNYVNKNKVVVASMHREYERRMYRCSEEFRITKSIRSRMRSAIKNNSKSSSTLNLIGCTVSYLKEHLESQFTDNMSWDNYGVKGWHIDHIIPCASFDLSKEEEQRKCFHYTNLQPLWWYDNIKKGARIL